jgi:hypothetical protein
LGKEMELEREEISTAGEDPGSEGEPGAPKGAAREIDLRDLNVEG